MTEAMVETEGRTALLARVPREVHEALRTLGYEERRSLNSLVVQYLQEGIARTQATRRRTGDTRAGRLPDVA